MRFKPPNSKRLQGAADARRRVRRRTFVLQEPDNKADAVPCERLPDFYHRGSPTAAPSFGKPSGPPVSPLLPDRPGQLRCHF